MKEEKKTAKNNKTIDKKNSIKTNKTNELHLHIR